MNESREILNIAQAADFLGISKYTLRSLSISGEMPSFKIGRLWKYSRNDLVDHLRKQYGTRAEKKNDSPAAEV